MEEWPRNRIATYDEDRPPGAGTPEDPKVIWACTPGMVPGDAVKDKAKLQRLNGNPDVVDKRANRVGNLAKWLAKELGFPYAVLTGNSHDTKSKYSTLEHRPTGDYVRDKPHITIAFTNDRHRLLVTGHVYVEMDPDFIPTALMKFRVVNGNPRRVIDLDEAETLAAKLERERKRKEEANRPKNKRGMC
ncbi:hypothetical protein PG991_002857 [Apiospora marii]|uniref:Uncharacterized protein n=1 Tax=Apiospora marii TaxID=335849 RepID=A0ABR1SGQ7_9PEZI